MNKEEFLKNLESKLEVLNKSEREDILNEYEQHIELRMKSGLSEEGAIKDFGDLDELVKEILEAYNVDPEYGRKKKKIFYGKNAGEAVTKNAAVAGKRLREIGGASGGMLVAFGKRIKKAVSRCLAICLLPLKKMKSWFEHRKEEPGFHDDRTEKTAMEKIQVQTISRKIWKLFLWCCLLGLKCLVLAVIWPVVIGEILGIVGFGALIVFLFMGYPVWGLTIMTAGCLAAGWAVLWLAKEILFWKLNEESQNDARIYREGEACRV